MRIGVAGAGEESTCVEVFQAAAGRRRLGPRRRRQSAAGCVEDSDEEELDACKWEGNAASVGVEHFKSTLISRWRMQFGE
jgi:hypothetical protein